MRDTPMADIPCKMHAYEAAPVKRYAYEMVHGRCTPINYPSIEDMYLGNESTQIIASLLVCETWEF
jgi:hypothetical protein